MRSEVDEQATAHYSFVRLDFGSVRIRERDGNICSGNSDVEIVTALLVTTTSSLIEKMGGFLFS